MDWPRDVAGRARGVRRARARPRRCRGVGAPRSGDDRAPAWCDPSRRPGGPCRAPRRPGRPPPDDILGRAMTTVVYDAPGVPRVTLTKTAQGAFEATIEVEGLAPQRAASAEERFVGISSLDPPTVRARPRRNVRQVHRTLVAL